MSAPSHSRLDHLQVDSQTVWTWDYGHQRPALLALYERAKREQWDAAACLPWDSPVDVTEAIVPDRTLSVYGTRHWLCLTDVAIRDLRARQLGWMLSQVLHCEQGALLAAGQLINGAPDIDTKLVAGTQVADEARHVETLQRYVRDKVGQIFPIAPVVHRVLDDVLSDPRWDVKCLGTQIILEGITAGMLDHLREARDPLLASIVDNLGRDEERHLALAEVILGDFYRAAPPVDRGYRESLTVDLCRQLRAELLADGVAQTLGLAPESCCEVAGRAPAMVALGARLFGRVTANLERVGLLSDGLTDRLAAIGVTAKQAENSA
jgi:hypothetical protein